MFDHLRVPRPGNISQELARLQTDELVLRRSGGSWSLTPLGETEALSIVGEVDAHAVAAEIASEGTANLAGAEHALIPPELAPVRFLPAVRRIIASSSFKRNVFCMTRFPKEAGDAADPVGQTIDTVGRVLKDRGLTMHLASDRSADDELFGNVAAHIWGSKYGVALLEARQSRADSMPQLNDNVLIEVGAMLATGRRCCLLKDRDAPKPPTDFVAQIYKELDFDDQEAVGQAINGWVADDLGLG
ncbi:MAG TPA: hypothetical protein VF520_07220 [Thermoleophilaceae bacterium]|jgi:hypothetical protein